MARRSSREDIVAAALAAFGAAESAVTIDAVARAAGITKQGVLYHFADKSELRLAMLERVLRQWERAMGDVLARDFTQAPAGERIRAYARVAARGDVVPGEATLLAEILSHPTEAHVYALWTGRWFITDAGVDPVSLARMRTAWLAANSLWSAILVGKIALEPEDIAGILGVIDELTARG